MRGPALLRAAEAAATALLWVALVLGSSVLALTVPVYTSGLEQALHVPASAGLSTADTLKLAGEVRALVADPQYDPLPATWRGRPAFDAAAVDHLVDVRNVIGGARLATGLVALVLAAYVAWSVARRRMAPLARGMRVAAVVLAVAVVAAAVVATTAFDAFFTAFHQLFFAAGTWTFPADSLLIRLFPEPFWETSGAIWAGLSLAGAAALAVCARLMRGAAARGDASRTTKDV